MRNVIIPVSQLRKLRPLALHYTAGKRESQDHQVSLPIIQLVIEEKDAAGPGVGVGVPLPCFL